MLLSHQFFSLEYFYGNACRKDQQDYTQKQQEQKSRKHRQPVQPVCFQQIGFEQKGQQKTGGHDNDYEYEFGIFKSEQMLKRCQNTEKKGIQEECDSIFRWGKAERGRQHQREPCINDRGCNKHQTEKNVSADDNITSPIGGGAEQGESPRAFRILQENLLIGKEFTVYGGYDKNQQARALLFGVLRETPIIKEGKYEGNGGDEKKGNSP